MESSLGLSKFVIFIAFIHRDSDMSDCRSELGGKVVESSKNDQWSVINPANTASQVDLSSFGCTSRRFQQQVFGTSAGQNSSVTFTFGWDETKQKVQRTAEFLDPISSEILDI